MSESIVGKDGIQPYRFSDCSRSAYFSSINQGHAMCLQNKPNSVKVSNSFGILNMHSLKLIHVVRGYDFCLIAKTRVLKIMHTLYAVVEYSSYNRIYLGESVVCCMCVGRKLFGSTDVGM